MSDKRIHNDRYVIMRLEDVKAIESFFNEEIIPRDYGYREGMRLAEKIKPILPVLDRLKQERGSLLGLIAHDLKMSPVCPACKVSGEEHKCQSLWTQKAGRRLQRIIRRTQGLLFDVLDEEDKS